MSILLDSGGGQRMEARGVAGAIPAQKKTARTVFSSCREASDATYLPAEAGRLDSNLRSNIYTIL
jgi:hypothetical protein